VAVGDLVFVMDFNDCLDRIGRWQRKILLIFGALMLLAACSGTITEYVAPMLPSRPAEAHPPEPEPAYRQIIAARMSEIFPAATEARNVRISATRKVDYLSATAWRVCLKAETKDVTNRSSDARTYVLLIQRDRIVDRRLANAADRCDEEPYEPLK
jgi:hypothetical protein